MDHSDNRYELIEVIGSGGMAEVFRARMIGAVGFEKQVAIKRLLPEVNEEQELVERFIDEARLTARLSHPNICQILDFGVMDDRYFITMEYVNGLDLDRIIQAVDLEEESVPLDIALYIVCAILRGLKYVHEAVDDESRPLGIVHRDVSPQNVLLSINGDVKLGDLGAATANPEIRTTRTEKHFRIGKVLYMAPEHRSGNHVDARADLYSTGILLTELLIGMDEFQKLANRFLAGLDDLWSKIPESVTSPVGRSLSEIVEKALAEDPGDRYQNADEMLNAIDELRIEYAPSISMGSVARFVETWKRRIKDTKKREIESIENHTMEITSIISLHTDEIEQLIPTEETDAPTDVQLPPIPPVPPMEDNISPDHSCKSQEIPIEGTEEPDCANLDESLAPSGTQSIELVVDEDEATIVQATTIPEFDEQEIEKDHGFSETHKELDTFALNPRPEQMKPLFEQERSHHMPISHRQTPLPNKPISNLQPLQENSLSAHSNQVSIPSPPSGAFSNATSPDEVPQTLDVVKGSSLEQKKLLKILFVLIVLFVLFWVLFLGSLLIFKFIPENFSS